MLASFLVYAICQQFDVWACHREWWAFPPQNLRETPNDFCRGAKQRLPLLISQFLNTLFVYAGGFLGVFISTPTLISIIASSYVIFVCTSLLDTPLSIWRARLNPGLQSWGPPPAHGDNFALFSAHFSSNLLTWAWGI